MKFRFALALLLPASASVAQPTLTNDGATLAVQAGATLYVAGTVRNNATSTLTNIGTVQLTGDLVNVGTLSSSGTLLFSGTANQAFTPGPATVATLVLNNTGATGQRTLSLPADLTITSALTLQSGLLRTAPTATITLPEGATLSGEAPGQYVQGNLRILRATGNGVLNFGHGLLLDRTGLGQLAATRTAGLLIDNLSRAVNLGTRQASSIDRIWTVEVETAPTAAVPVTLQWLADDDNGLMAFSQLQAWRADLGTASWAPAGSPQPATVSGNTRSFSFSTAALGRLTVAGSDAPLPVTLVSFTAVAKGEDALLRWITASERNNDYFEVEASADGQVFNRIGTVAGHGTTAVSQQYQLVDKTIARYAVSLVYYRLRQVDLAGPATYSPVRTVSVGKPGPTLYPNPTAHTATLSGAEAGALVQVYDARGRLVLIAQADAAGTAALVLPASLPGGLYLVRSEDGPALRLMVK